MDKVKFKKIGIIVGVAVAVLIAIILVVTMYITPKKSYDAGVESYNLKLYSDAILYFEEANGFKDSEDMIVKCGYNGGMALMEGKDYSGAAELFKKAGEYKNAKELMNYCEGMSYLESGMYDSAYDCFLGADGVEGVEAMMTACELMEAESYYDDGDLVEAKELFSALPADFSYNGISVSERLATLEKYNAFINMIGVWKCTSGYYEVRQTHDSTGIWHNWYVDDARGELEIESCTILDDGSVNIKGSTGFWMYTDYSSVGSIVDSNREYVEINFNETVNGTISGLEIAGFTKLTVSGGSASVNYYEVSPNEDAYFTYLYKADNTFTK